MHNKYKIEIKELLYNLKNIILLKPEIIKLIYSKKIFNNKDINIFYNILKNIKMTLYIYL